TSYQLLPAPGTLRVFDEQLKPLDLDIYDEKVWGKYGWNPMDETDFEKEFSPLERKEAPAFFAGQLWRSKRFFEALNAVTGKSGSVSFTVIGSDCKSAPDSIVIYRDRDSQQFRTLFRPRSFTRTDGVRVTEDDLKKVMYAAGDGVVTARSLAAASRSEAVRATSAVNGGPVKFVCEDHNKLASNSRIQDHIINVLDVKKRG
ncbi:MAG: hypothetical protein AB7J13_02635, partial [Pyrinomonadaceae bacterium]